jgi:Flp pilus assembly protein TadG
MARLNFRRFFSKDDRGAGTIEFVLVLPLFLAALALAFEFGQIFIAHQNTVNNVRAAARYLSRTDCRDVHEERAQNIVQTGRLLDDSPPQYPTTFDSLDFCQNGRVRINVLVQFPLTLFPLASRAVGPSLPFRVREDLPIGGG